MITINEKINNLTEKDVKKFIEDFQKRGFKVKGRVTNLKDFEFKKTANPFMLREFEFQVAEKPEILKVEISILYRFYNHSYNKKEIDGLEKRYVERYLIDRTIKISPPGDFTDLDSIESLPSYWGRVEEFIDKFEKDVTRLIGRGPVWGIFPVEIERIEWLSNEYKKLDKLLPLINDFRIKLKLLIPRKGRI